MSAKAKRIIGGTVVAAVLLISGGIVFNHVRSRPSDSALLGWLSHSVENKVTFTEVERQVQVAGPNVHLSYEAKGAVAEPLYSVLDTATFLRDTLQLDATKLIQARKTLAGPEGARVRDLAGIPEKAEDPLSIVVLKPASPKGEPYQFRGSAVAQRMGGKWIFTAQSGEFVGVAPAGFRRTSFKERTFLADDSNDIAALKQVVAEQADFISRVEKAREQIAAEIKQQREARLATLLDVLQPGSLFAGLATSRYNQDPVRIYFEITDLKASTRQVTALLRNDGGWGDARTFQGTWKADEEVSTLELSLSTRANQAIREAGPLLESSDTWTIPFRVDLEGKLAGETTSFVYTLDRLQGDELARVKSELMSELTVALESTRVDTIYHGAAISKRSQASEPILLRFTKQENEGALLAAVLESPDHDSWKRPLRGTIIANRNRNAEHSVRLQMRSEERVRNAPAPSVLAYNEDLRIALKPQGQDLVGEDGSFTYRFTRASEAYLAERAQKRRNAEQRFLSVYRPGSGYDGVMRERGGFVARSRLRVVKIDTASATMTLSLSSLQQPGIAHEFSGSYELSSGMVHVGSSGKGTYNPKGALRVPFFSRDDAFKATLVLTDTSIRGELENERWEFDFPVGTPITASAGDAEASASGFPDAEGMYAWNQSAWVKLPRNGGKFVQSAGAIARQFVGILTNPQSGKNGEKIAELIFSGSDPVPSFDGENLQIAFRGARPPRLPNAPEDYPAIEATTTTLSSDGTRRAAIVRIAPSVGAFGDARLPASVLEPEEGLFVLAFTRRVAPGRYCVAIGDNLFEFMVK